MNSQEFAAQVQRLHELQQAEADAEAVGGGVEAEDPGISTEELQELHRARERQHAAVNNAAFKNVIRQYLIVEKRIKEAQEVAKALRAEKTAMENEIKSAMNQLQIRDLTISGTDTISLATKTMTKPLNKENILETLTEVFDGDAEKATAVFEAMNERREKVETEAVKHTTKRGPRAPKK